MNFGSVEILIILLAGYLPISANKFAINQSNSSEHVVLSEMVSKYTKEYVTDKQMFISVTFASSKREQQLFQEDFLMNLLDERHLTEFTRNIFNIVNKSFVDERNAFNLILIDDIKLLS